jgi:hypothetical protein
MDVLTRASDAMRAEREGAAAPAPGGRARIAAAG